MNITDEYKIFFEILNPDTKIDEQFKTNVENLAMKFPKEFPDAISIVFINFLFTNNGRKNPR